MTFADLGLSEAIFQAANSSGYTTATSIQTQAIPILLEGLDLVGCSETGSGKTAAFAMPLLQRLDLEQRAPQILVLAPTRELATQVADSFRVYGSGLPDLEVLAIYGGAPYGPQLSALRRGVHVVVGTPGRVIDHVKQGALDLSSLRSLVLDEADEMLHMGFIEDVQWVLSQAPKERQIALFSATMPEPIRQIAQDYLRDPIELKNANRQRTAASIEQQFICVKTPLKVEALARVLEVGSTDGVIVFVKTRAATVEIADKLSARGFRAAPLNGEIVQSVRQRTVDQLKRGQIDVLVATDVAARGLDVERINLVVNYDLPRESEAYVHRIGRTGRAGRAGRAISLIAPAARRSIQHLSRAIGQQIQETDIPSAATINASRVESFKTRLLGALSHQDVGTFAGIIGKISEETGESPERLAAAAAVLSQSGRSLFVKQLEADSPRSKNERPERARREWDDSPRDGNSPRWEKPRADGGRVDGGRVDGGRNDRTPRPGSAPRSGSKGSWQSYRVEVGRKHGIGPKHLVGAIANEVGIEGRDIGRIDIHDFYSVIDLPTAMPQDVLDVLQGVQVVGRPLKLSAFDGESRRGGDRFAGKSRPNFAPKKFGKSSPQASGKPGKKDFKKKPKKQKAAAKA